MSSSFGPRVAPIPGASTYHRGTDFSHTFDQIRAVEAGRVVAVNVWPALGNSVWIQHDGYFSKSGHMKNRTLLRVGEDVDENQSVGVMGKTGTATDTHLHFEITPGKFHTSNTGQVDPVAFIQSRLAGTAGGGSSPLEEIMAKLDDEDRAWLDRQFGIVVELLRVPGQVYGWPQATLNDLRDLAPLIRDTQDRVRGRDPRGDMLQLIREDLGKPITAEVDEAALAKELAPLLPAYVGTLSDSDLSRIADAAADERDRRERERLAS
ncbi:hypothetical protein ASF63_14070 [Microbacterium sp. Leaf320]|nr:hypothetical protein ASF63_14070 [Microbacterium sp. Leaf320]